MKMIKLSLITAISLLAIILTTPVVEAASEVVSFGKGKTSTAINGKIKGHDDIDYLVRASAGQTLIVDVSGNKFPPYFNVLPPGSTGEAVFVGSTSGDHYEGVLDKDGDWIIRVYQMGDTKDSNKTTSYKLNISIPPATAKSSDTDRAEKACLAAVAETTGLDSSKLKIKDVSEAQSGIHVMVTVPDATAPWSCLSSKDGKVDGVTFTGSEGKL